MRGQAKAFIMGTALFAILVTSVFFGSLKKNSFEMRKKRIIDSFTKSATQAIPSGFFNKEVVEAFCQLDFFAFFPEAGIVFAGAKKNPAEYVSESLACLAVWASKSDAPVEITKAAAISFIRNFHLGGNDLSLLVAIAEIFEEYAFLKVTPEIKKEYEIALLRSIANSPAGNDQVATATNLAINRVLKIFPDLKAALAVEAVPEKEEILHEKFSEKASGEKIEE